MNIRSLNKELSGEETYQLFKLDELTFKKPIKDKFRKEFFSKIENEIIPKEFEEIFVELKTIKLNVLSKKQIKFLIESLDDKNDKFGYSFGLKPFFLILFLSFIFSKININYLSHFKRHTIDRSIDFFVLLANKGQSNLDSNNKLLFNSDLVSFLKELMLDCINLIKNEKEILAFGDFEFDFIIRNYLETDSSKALTALIYFKNFLEKEKVHFNSIHDPYNLILEFLELEEYMTSNTVKEYKKYVKFSKTFNKRINFFNNFLIEKYSFTKDLERYKLDSLSFPTFLGIIFEERKAFLKKNQVKNLIKFENILFQKFTNYDFDKFLRLKESKNNIHPHTYNGYCSFVANRIYDELGFEKLIEFFEDISKDYIEFNDYYKYIKYYKENSLTIPSQILVKIF